MKPGQKYAIFSFTKQVSFYCKSPDFIKDSLNLCNNPEINLWLQKPVIYPIKKNKKMKAKVLAFVGFF